MKPRRTFISCQEKKGIIKSYLNQKKTTEIARITGLKPGTVSQIVRKYLKTGKIEKGKVNSCRRQRKLSEEQIAQVRAWIEEDWSISLKQLSDRCLREFNIKVSRTTLHGYKLPAAYKCEAINCNNNRYFVTKCKLDITFHKFPEPSDLLEAWIQFCQQPKGWKPSQCSTVCSKHFKTEDFIPASQGKLRLNAVPSISYPKRRRSLDCQVPLDRTEDASEKEEFTCNEDTAPNEEITCNAKITSEEQQTCNEANIRGETTGPADTSILECELCSKKDAIIEAKAQEIKLLWETIKLLQKKQMKTTKHEKVSNQIDDSTHPDLEPQEIEVLEPYIDSSDEDQWEY
ncbi:uncharacterized protein LOC131263292 [Anopheles coustani]|uniref:uncharacterized protein LOC131263292 n=1 Tax=Anopheles coustani TaxID=139045 RepID=UPI002659E275|nr:uncharacterized protein LOC131263292 [Anopheles coustani]XP_058121452.1 uncharacterized protein LOC131263292 [Anopheles coustani]